jgi:uncharacterized membrane protein YkgB
VLEVGATAHLATSRAGYLGGKTLFPNPITTHSFFKTTLEIRTKVLYVVLNPTF